MRICMLVLLISAVGGIGSVSVFAGVSSFTLVSDGNDPAVIVVNSSDSQITGAAANLASKLEAISGAAFSVVAGDGDGGIVVGLASDFSGIPFAVTFSDGPDPNMAKPEFLREQCQRHNDRPCLEFQDGARTGYALPIYVGRVPDRHDCRRAAKRIY